MAQDNPINRNSAL